MRAAARVTELRLDSPSHDSTGHCAWIGMRRDCADKTQDMITVSTRVSEGLPGRGRRGKGRRMSELVPQAVRDLLAFYTENCPEVRFGDLDLRVLERSVESIDEAAQKVIEAEEAVAQARAQFREVESGLLVKANRTLSFLKIFVDEDPEQQAKLEAISNGLPGGRRKAKAAADAAGSGEPRQRRTRKSKKAEEAEGDAQPVEGEAQQAEEELMDEALEKSGIVETEPVEELEEIESRDEVEVEVAPAPAAKKSGTKSGK